MDKLTREQREYAVGRLVRLIEHRDITQQDLAAQSGVTQPTICKIEKGYREPGSPDRYLPGDEILAKLFSPLGHKLSDIVTETDRIADVIFGYLATPLTGLSSKQDDVLRSTIRQIRNITADPEFSDRPFEMYWPGDHTHPTKHSDVTAGQVYITDRTRAATHDFILMLCACTSYGVGQENEIASQGGVPAIRLVPEKLSRMMKGSFLRTHDICFAGSLDDEIRFDNEQLRSALIAVRHEHFRRLGLYRGMNGDSFGGRLEMLINTRHGNREEFANDLGISTSYLHSLIGESFAVSNPSIRLLKRMAIRLDVNVSYLIGESLESDTVWSESNAAWHVWIEQNPDVSATDAVSLRNEWRSAYQLSRRERSSMSTISHRRESAKQMSVADWNAKYRAQRREKLKTGASNGEDALQF